MKTWFMIGVPGSGKSTFVNKIIDEYVEKGNYYLASTDNLVEKWSNEHNITYSEGFKDFIFAATAVTRDEIKEAVNNHKDVILDQTSLTPKSRKPKLAMFPKYYHKIAIVMKTPDMDELNRRLANRPGKIIPQNVIDTMIKSFNDSPQEIIKEGFDEVWWINGDNIQKLFHDDWLMSDPTLKELKTTNAIPYYQHWWYNWMKSKIDGDF